METVNKKEEEIVVFNKFLFFLIKYIGTPIICVSLLLLEGAKRIEFKHYERLPLWEGNIIILPNHRSWWDVVIVPHIYFPWWFRELLRDLFDLGKELLITVHRVSRWIIDERVKIKIPAGARDGATIRVPSKGEERAAPGESGDLQVELRMLAHPYFRREGNDILLDVPVRYSEAVKGAKIEVPTIDGPVKVTVPPGSSSGRKLRLKGRGVPTPGTAERGDQYVILQVAVPSSLPEEFLRLVDRIAEFEATDPRGHWN